jgi:DNA gyrase subunit A
LIGADAIGPEGKALLVSAYGYGKMTERQSDFPLQRRGGSGVIAIKTNEKSGPLVVMRIITTEDEVLLITAEGTSRSRTLISQVKVLRRAALGVRLMKIEPPDRLAACSVFEGV